MNIENDLKVKKKVDKLVKLGDKNVIFVSRVPATLKKAKRVCNKIGYTLIDFKLTNKESEKLFDALQGWMNEKCKKETPHIIP